MQRLILVHRWGGNPSGDWYPWLREKLEEKGLQVEVPPMPNPEHPIIEEWVAELRKTADTADARTFFVGHSIGCQTILRYLETLPDTAKAKGVILVAPWTKLKPLPPEEVEEGALDIARPWVEKPLQWDKMRKKAEHFAALFSDNDYYVYPAEAQTFFQKLGAETLVQKGKGHFLSGDGVHEIPIILEWLEKMGMERSIGP